MTPALVDQSIVLPSKSDRLTKGFLALYHLRLCHRSERSISEALNSSSIVIGKLFVERDCAEQVSSCCATSISHKLPRAKHTIYIGSWDNYIYAVNPDDGSLKRRYFLGVG